MSSTVRRPPTRQRAALDLRPAVERRPRALPVGRCGAGVQGAVLEHLEEFEARLHRRDVTEVPCSRLRTMARRAAAETDLAAVRDAESTAADQRSIRVSPGEVTGMSTWTISLPVATSTRLWSAVDGSASELPQGSPVGLKADHARVDALVDLATAHAEIRTTIELVAPIGSGPASQTDCGPLDLRDEPLHDLPEAFGGPQQARRVRYHVGGGGGGGGRAGGGGGSRAGGGGRRRWRPAGGPRRRTGRQAAPGPLGRRPRIDRDAHEQRAREVWFVSGLTDVPTLGSPPPATVVDLLSDADVTLRVAWSDPVTGAIRAQDPTVYRPCAALARQVRSRDGTCRFPGCAQPARRTPLDHVIPARPGRPRPPTSCA